MGDTLLAFFYGVGGCHFHEIHIGIAVVGARAGLMVQMVSPPSWLTSERIPQSWDAPWEGSL